MQLNELIQHLKELEKHAFDKIMVTGPQRSGTTIASIILAEELNYRYVDELDANTLVDAMHFYRHAKRFILQAPMLAAYCHVLPMVVVYMVRPIAEIIASEKRIGWQCQESELAKYFTKTGLISEVKYKAWREYQQPKLCHAFELDYHSMNKHPLWIDREKRINFSQKQTMLNEE